MVLGTFIYALAEILSTIINIYIWIVIISALISWVNPDPYNPIVQILYKLTHPLYAKIRSFIPTTIAGIDLSPFIIVVILHFINLFFVQLLFNFARNL
ncbi:MAG: YggT family protein [Helicobacter sp.]|nr:YggT family protein [Helicobacter sp.]